MQEHMNVEENQALGSTLFMLMVGIPYSPIVRQFATDIMQCIFGNKLFCD